MRYRVHLVYSILGACSGERVGCQWAASRLRVGRRGRRRQGVDCQWGTSRTAVAHHVTLTHSICLPVLHECRDRQTHHHVLFETHQRVKLAAQRCLREDTGSLLERGCHDPTLGR